MSELGDMYHCSLCAGQADKHSEILLYIVDRDHQYKTSIHQ